MLLKCCRRELKNYYKIYYERGCYECFHWKSGVGNVILDYHKFVSANVGKIGFLYMNAFVGGGVGLYIGNVL